MRVKKELRDIYMSTEIPPELDAAVDRALSGAAPARARRPRRAGRVFARVAAPLAAACAVFVLMLNTVPTFAEAMYDVPVLGGLCRVLTIDSYHREDGVSVVDVQLPAIDAGEGGWTEEVNSLIRETVDAEVAESEQRAKEYYDAYTATGGNPDEYTPVQVRVDYEVYRAEDGILSFSVIKTESSASVYSSFHYYNYDIDTGEELTLEGLLGPNWRELAHSAVESGLEALDGQSRAMLWEEADIDAAVDEASSFYVNAGGRVVLVFDKYTLGAGALGRLEFELGAGA